MRKNLLPIAVFLAGLVVVGWVAVGYVGSNPLGALVAVLVAVGYIAGAMELFRYRQATHALQQVLHHLASAPEHLGEWLDRVPASLRHPVRLRVEGERAPLPAPTLAPYLVGLLVLLGMLGTLLGMMATLRGTGIALESATDLQAIRGSLAAPVKGLAFAFGTSIAGVATSAMLGLLSALARRERAQVTQQLDAKASTTLRVFSQAYQREQSFRLLQAQTELMPALIDRLQGMMGTMEQQATATGERHVSSQEAFHAKTEATFNRLALSVEQSLRDGVADSARAASAALQPVVEATMQGIARETAALHHTMNHAVQRQMEGLSAGFEKTSVDVTAAWQAALADQRAANNAVAQDLRDALQGFNESFDQRSSGMVDRVTAQLEGVTLALSQQMDGVASSFGTQLEHAAASLGEHVSQASAGFATTSDAVAAGWRDALAGQRAANEASAADLRVALEQFTQAFAQRSDEMAGQVFTKIEAATQSHASTWNNALANQAAAADTLAARQEAALTTAITTFEQHASSLVDTVRHAQEGLQATLESRDEARLKAWTSSLTAMTDELSTQWKEAGEAAAAQHKDISDTLSATAADITRQAQSHASATIAEITRLVDAAAEAPKAAADVVAELRQKLSDSMVRDTAMLEERTRLLATLETLLDAVNHASTEQREAVDALVSASADMLERAGTRFTEQVEAETGKIGGIAEQITVGAANVSGLSESFGGAVAAFGQANEALMERLQVVADALDKSMVRSDEQLAYYVAQAREVVDLSVMSQKQIVEDMQQLAAQRSGAGQA